MLLFFFWRIIALQCCGGLRLTSLWICHNYIYISPLFSSLPPPTPSYPLRSSERQAGLPVLWSSFLLVICFTHDGVYILSVHWKDWCWSWNSKSLANWWDELTHWKRPWCWVTLRAWGEGDDRGWDGWMASPTQWTWVWVNSGSWWWTGRPGMLRFMRLQRVGHEWVTELAGTIRHLYIKVRESQPIIYILH